MREASNGKEVQEKLRFLSLQQEDPPINGIGWQYLLVTQVTIVESRFIELGQKRREHYEL